MGGLDEMIERFHRWQSAVDAGMDPGRVRLRYLAGQTDDPGFYPPVRRTAPDPPARSARAQAEPVRRVRKSDECLHPSCHEPVQRVAHGHGSQIVCDNHA